jgi:alanine racemase
MKHLAYSIEQVAEIVSGELIKGSKQENFKHLVFDSRKLTFPKRSLFFAILSNRHDGHNFISELYEKGVRNFVISNEESIKGHEQASFVVVEDTIGALQALAKHHREQFSLPVIGVTGSNGKTIVKEWLNQLLSKDQTVSRSPKSYNSQIGVPLSVWQLTKEHTFGIYEAGISQPGEMENLRQIIQPSIGVITNIGHAHDEGFLNVRQKVSEKLSLFTKCEVLIYCKDYHDINDTMAGIRERQQEGAVKLFSWSHSSEADLQITNTSKKQAACIIEGKYLGKDVAITIPFSDDASIENATHCWAVMLYLGYENDVINERMGTLSRVAMRLELKKAVNNCSVINDSYNSDLESLRIALDFLNQQRQHEKRIVILSDLLQTGMTESDLYDEVARVLQDKQVDQLVGIGASINRQRSKFEGIKQLNLSCFPDTDAFIKEFPMDSFSNSTILLKGARSYRFERISRLLEEKVHETILEINLDAIAHNLNVYQSLLKPKTKIMGMVKEFSYGSGSYEIASLLEFYHVDYLAVAYADEGVELRKAGITLPIMVMSPEENSFEKIVSHRLEPEIYSFELYRAFEEVLMEYGGTSIVPYPIHVKLDTGMHRLGFDDAGVKKLAGAIELNPVVEVKSVFSHLAASDEKKHDKFTKEQFKLFEELASNLDRSGKPKPIRHILNSAGVVRFPDHQYDMVRLGIGLYGVDSAKEVQKNLLNVSTLKTRIAQIKTVSAKETVGYNRSYKSTGKKRIAIVNIGYADGLDRRLGNEAGYMLVGGEKAPIIGNVCMDMAMLDVTDIQGAKRGDEVVVFGEDLSVQEIAATIGTIPYEMLTGISKRVKRVYYQE